MPSIYLKFYATLPLWYKLFGGMTSLVSPRTKTSGLAQRTLKNLYFVEQEQKRGADVHVVTQVVNSLLSLLVFPVQKEIDFFKQFEEIPLPSSLHPSPSDLTTIVTTIRETIGISSLHVKMFDRCENMACFFRRIRNALSHKNIDFDSDSLLVSEVKVTLCDRKKESKPFDWEVTMIASDLRYIGIYVAKEILKRGL